MRLLLLAIAVVVVVYVLGRRLRAGSDRRPVALGARDPTATIRQLARVRDVDGLRHFLTSKTSSDQIRAAAEQELIALSTGADSAVAPRALVALSSALGTLTEARQKDTADRLVAELRREVPAVLAWLTSGPGLDKTGPITTALAALRKDTGAPSSSRVAASSALLGAGVLGARAGAFLAAYRRQIDVEEAEDDDMGGGTALFSDPVDEPCAVLSAVGIAEEVLLSTSGKVLLRTKIGDERLSEATDGTPARVERRWDVSPPPPARLAAILGPCQAAIDQVVSDEPRSA